MLPLKRLTPISVWFYFRNWKDDVISYNRVKESWQTHGGNAPPLPSAFYRFGQDFYLCGRKKNNMVPCFCINDEGRPDQIPADKWVKKDDKYRITHVYFHPKQGIQGCTLYEKPLDETCKPYETFKLSRFAIHHDDLEAFIELCKMCTDLNDLEIEKLIEESELQTV